MVNDELPDGWQMTTLGEATKPMQKRVNPQDYPDLPYIGMENVEAHTMRLLGTVPAKEMKSTADTFSAGDVLYGRLRPYLNKVYLPDFDGLCSTEFIVFRKVPHLYSKYLQYFLNSWEFVQFSNSLNAGDRPRVKFEQFADYSFPVPPLPEQERIVAKIEELFTQLEAGTSALERVQAGLRRYKASVLKAAVEGKLLNDEVRMQNDGELPEGWRVVKMEEIAETIGGATKGRKLEGKATITLPYLRVANVQRGRLDLELIKKIEILKSEIEKYRLLDGDVVLTEGGDWDKLGRSAIWRDQIPNCIHQNHIFRARVKSSDALPEWLMYYTNSEPGQDYFKESSKQTTNLASINLTQLRACPIPLPPLEEQRRIVAEVERRMSVAREVESVVEKALARSARLRQAVLKSAFEGKLT